MGRLTVSLPPWSPASTRPTRRSTHSRAPTTGSPTSEHTDVTSCGCPPRLGSILRAVTLPSPHGGDTNAGAGTARAVLWRPRRKPEPVQRLAEQLTDGARRHPGEFGYNLAQAPEGRRTHRCGRGSGSRGWSPSSTPYVRVHPETGRKSLFDNPGFVSHIDGVSTLRAGTCSTCSTPRSTKPEHIVRHRWHPGDVAKWDNAAAVHDANRDYGDARRGHAPHHPGGGD